MNHFRFYILLFFAIFLGGCGFLLSSTKDVTKDKRYWGGYVLNEDYIVQRDLFLFETGKQPQLYVPESRIGFTAGVETFAPVEILAPSVRAYLDNPAAFPYVSGIVTEGTRLKVVKFEWYNLGKSEPLQIYAKPLDGRFKGEPVKLNCGLSLPIDGTDDYYLRKPNPEYLKPAKENESERQTKREKDL